jgi:hypothetical protein
MQTTPPTWTNDIAKLFTPTDIAHMKQQTMSFGPNQLDLSSYASVKTWAPQILPRVTSGNMPPSGTTQPPGEQPVEQIPWTPEMVSTFQAWIAAGCPEQ